MVPGLGGSEIIVIAIVALIVIGPKDLPKMLREVGRFIGRARSMADEFRQSFDDMARQSELDDLRKEVEALKSGHATNGLITEIKDDLYRIEADVDQSLSHSHGRDYGNDSHGDVPSPDAADLADAKPPPPKPKRVRKKKTPTPIDTHGDMSGNP